jgi:hypothetical protein
MQKPHPFWVALAHAALPAGRPAIAFQEELDHISATLSSVAEHYGIEVPPPDSPACGA